MLNKILNGAAAVDCQIETGCPAIKNYHLRKAMLFHYL